VHLLLVYLQAIAKRTMVVDRIKEATEAVRTPLNVKEIK
jgi:hypothetical protein